MDSKDKVFEYIREKSDFGWFIGELGTNRDGTLYMILDESFTEEYNTNAKVAGAFVALSSGLENEFENKLYGFDIQWDRDEDGVVDASIDYVDKAELCLFLKQNRKYLTEEGIPELLRMAKRAFTETMYDGIVDFLYDCGVDVDKILKEAN